MEIKINIEKKYAYGIMTLLALVLLAVGLNALDTGEKATQAWHNNSMIEFNEPLDLTNIKNQYSAIFTRNEDNLGIGFAIGDDSVMHLNKNLTLIRSNLEIEDGQYFKLPESEHPPVPCNQNNAGAMYFDSYEGWNGEYEHLCVCEKIVIALQNKWVWSPILEGESDAATICS